MSAKHTPGPWEACKVGDYGDYDGQCLVVLGDDMRVAVTLGSDKTAKANASLIAAAPDLLDALREIADDYAGRFDMASPSTNPGMKYVVSQARAAIAKATGEAA